MRLEAIEGVERWPAASPAVAVLQAGSIVDTAGDVGRPHRWASITKLLTAAAVLLAVDEQLLDLDEDAGPPGSTVRHLLAHTSGLSFEGPAQKPPGVRRIYSNAGYEVLGCLLSERAGQPYAEVIANRVLGPLGMTAHARGGPAAGAEGSLGDLARLAAELARPRVFPPTVVARISTVVFPGLPGLLPGVGFQQSNDWGLGAEVRARKRPHWTGAKNSPATFGHFGASGGFVWVDPANDLACACLTDTDFGSWALAAWPAMSDAIIAELRGQPPREDRAT